MQWHRLPLAVAVLAAAGLLLAQDYTPSPSKPPEAAVLKTIKERTEKLGDAIASLHQRGVPEPLLAEANVYYKAATWIVRHEEFYQKDYADWTLEALDRGLLRASQLARGESPWLQETGHSVVRAYLSRIDGSTQPYAVTLPAEYGARNNAGKKWRLDVVLHGRDKDLTEVKFLHQHAGDKPAPKEQQDFVQLDIYGRGNNAYRWAGETDVMEAIENFLAMERVAQREGLIDLSRVVLRGFSMGGAGSWHIGLHRPDRWCVIGPGAGFTSTHGYIAKLPDKLPDYQEACLHIYDAVDYAENAFDVPVVAYAGADDPQLQAARTIEAKLKPLGIPMTLLVAPGLGHTFPQEWRAKAEAEYAKYLEKGRPSYPQHVNFVTSTLKYPSCSWVSLLGLEQHYQRATVDASQVDSGYNVKTANVRALRLALPPGVPRQPVKVSIDDQEVEARPYQDGSGALWLYLEKREKHWASVLPEKLATDRMRHLQKIPGVQGPIDDAFMQPFLCVRPTGKGWHEATQKYAADNLARFAAEWDKYFRGELPVKDDLEVTPQDIAERSLILFGDPASNSLIAEVLDGLPLKWTKEQILLGGKTVSAADHVPVLIYPSPLNGKQYVVLNSGHTFHAAEFQATNAQLYPRLGDYALLKLAPTGADPCAVEVSTAGLFDDGWQAAKK